MLRAVMSETKVLRHQHTTDGMTQLARGPCRGHRTLNVGPFSHEPSRRALVLNRVLCRSPAVTNLGRSGLWVTVVGGGGASSAAQAANQLVWMVGLQGQTRSRQVDFG